MNAIKEFTVTFCTACIFAGGVRMLCARSNMSRSVQYALSLFMLCCIIGAAAGFGSLQFELPSAHERGSTVDASAFLAEQTFETALKNEGVEFNEITVCTDKNDDGGISIIEVVVKTDESYDRVAAVIGSEDYSLRVENE